jgi:dihydropyrimidinase
MTPAFDTVIRGGTVVTSGGAFRSDVGIRGETIAAVGLDLGTAGHEISAADRLIMPGGVDTHAHIQQLSASGKLNADTWESATTAAAIGGTTTVIAFAAQHIGMNLSKVVEDYSALARAGSLIDYTFHLILADPTPETLAEDVPALMKQGYASIKIFTTYERMKVDDEHVLDVLLAARANRALVCVHAENHGVIKWMTKRLVARGHHAMKFHALSHPRTAEIDGIERMVRLSALLDQPVMIFHVSTAEGAAVIRRARGEGIKIFGETCPQYLFLTDDDFDRPGAEAAKWVCSPPIRTPADQDALWRALALGDLQTISSDHAPYRFDESGKLASGPNARFDQVPSGMPGIELRMPLLFDAMVSRRRLGAAKFVELTASVPARLYGLHPRKGAIEPGADADIVIWDPDRETVISDAMMHDNTGFTPFVGRTLRGWPSTVLIRGNVVVDDGALKAAVGSGKFLPRTAGLSADPMGTQVGDHTTMSRMGIPDFLEAMLPAGKRL